MTYMMLCNAPALDLWPINNALLVAHLGPMLRAMSIRMQHIPHHMRIYADVPTTFHNKATDPALPDTVNGKHHLWEVWHTELQHRQAIMHNKPLQWKALMQSYVTTKLTPDTVHSPTPGQLHVESIQLACTCALCCCYALCMKREELSIFLCLWLSGAEFVVHVSAEVWLALGVFEGEERTGIVRFL